MKSDTQAIQDNYLYTKLSHWVKLVTLTGSAQIIVQATSLLTGILVVRLLPVDEYAYYTVANTMLGTMTVLSDGGIANGVMAQGGQAWQDKKRLGTVLSTGLDLRRKFAVVSLLVSIPILLSLLLRQGASWQTSTLIILTLIPAFYAALSDSLLEIVPKLHQKVKSIQGNQVNVSLGRLLISSLSLFLFPLTFVALLANGIPRLYGNVQLKKITNEYIEEGQLPDEQVRKDILSIVKRTLPGSIYYCVSSQITVWLLSIIGNTNSIAQIGALSRISMVLNLFVALYGTLIIPRFARLPSEQKLLIRYYSIILAGTTVLMLIVISGVGLFSDQILQVLGKGYMGLNKELVLSIIGSCLSIMAGIVFSLYSSRGWVIKPIISIPFNIISIAAGIYIFNLDKLFGVVSFNVFVAFNNLLLNASYCFYKTLNKISVE